MVAVDAISLIQFYILGIPLILLLIAYCVLYLNNIYAH